MKIMSPFTSLKCIVGFNVWKFKNISFGLFKQVDCDFVKVYWNNNLFHKNEYYFAILQIK